MLALAAVLAAFALPTHAARPPKLVAGKIYAVSPSGAHLRRLSRPGAPFQVNPAWSRDGQRLAFAESDGPPYEPFIVELMRRDGVVTRAVTEEQPDQAFTPSWSPDGTRLAITFTAYKYDPGRPNAVAVIGVDGTHPTDLAIPAVDPAWSPDGRTIAYAGGDERGSQLWSMAPDGTGKRRLAAPPPSFIYTAQPAWSPEGTRLAYVVRSASWQRAHVLVASADGAAAIDLTRGAAVEFAPAWSPDGKRIALVRLAAGGPRIVVERADGSGARTLVKLPKLTEATLSWSLRNELAFAFA